jgi:tight adherence protein C
MSYTFSITLIFLIPVFFLIYRDFSFEELSLKSIRRIGDKSGVREKLAELGYPEENYYENFRYRQIIISFALLSALFLFWIVSQFPMGTLVAISIFGASSVVLLTEYRLSQEVKRYRQNIESDFPVIVEALTLALSAGETPLSAMQRISTRGRGALSQEFKKVIEMVSSGIPFSNALDEMGRHVSSLAVRRFVDSIVIAMTRGAPLIDVLHSHAREARDFQRNRTLAAAAKAELSMMIPVVFLILPISILFALWPSLSNLNLFAQG